MVALRILGIFFGITAVWFLSGVFWPLETPEPNERAERLLLTNVSVVDVETGQINGGSPIMIKQFGG